MYMAAPFTSDQAADLAQYKDLLSYLVAILDKEATIPSPVLSSTNITEINTTIASALTNMQNILIDAAP